VKEKEGRIWADGERGGVLRVVENRRGELCAGIVKREDKGREGKVRMGLVGGNRF